MAERGTVQDYAGDPLYRGDLITYGTRQGNRVRMSDAIVLDIEPAYDAAGRLRPRLKVQPTGTDSGYGYGARTTLRTQWISAEHVRLVRAEAVHPL